MTPSVKEGPDLRTDLLDLKPEMVPLKAEKSSGELVPVPGQRAILYGDDEVEVVGNLYTPVSHMDLFPRIHEIVTEQYPVSFWKVETATGFNGAIARVTWFLWTEAFTYTFGSTDYILLLRAFNSYNKVFPLCVELGLMNTDNKGRIPLEYTRKRKRHRGDDLAEKVVSKTTELLENRDKLIDEKIPALDRAKFDHPVDTLEILSLCESNWIPQKIQKEIRYKFEADGCESMLDLVSLFGWYANRASVLNRNVVYRQENIYREMRNAANLK